ncbi:MAG: type II secretion system F family protein [Actinomycetota bacterium]|nr:type II secretion system F family protein [Actinomycetota bacterium]
MKGSELTYPAVLDQLAAHLRAGGTVHSGLRDLAVDAGHLDAGLRRVAESVEGGGGVPDALSAWRAERPAPDVAVVAAALEVAHCAGGAVAGPLEGLAAGLRDRIEGARELRAQSAQARMSAWVMGLAPLGALGLSLLSDHRVVAALVGTAGGRACLLAGFGLEALAAAWMRRVLVRAG